MVDLPVNQRLLPSVDQIEIAMLALMKQSLFHDTILLYNRLRAIYTENAYLFTLTDGSNDGDRRDSSSKKSAAFMFQHDLNSYTLARTALQGCASGRLG